MLQNAYFLAKIGADTAENEQDFAEILPIGRRVADPEASEAAQGGGGVRGSATQAFFPCTSSASSQIGTGCRKDPAAPIMNCNLCWHVLIYYKYIELYSWNV